MWNRTTRTAYLQYMTCKTQLQKLKCQYLESNSNIMYIFFLLWLSILNGWDNESLLQMKRTQSTTWSSQTSTCSQQHQRTDKANCIDSFPTIITLKQQAADSRVTASKESSATWQYYEVEHHFTNKQQCLKITVVRFYQMKRQDKFLSYLYMLSL